MPEIEQTSRRHDADDRYHYRRSLGFRELLPAIGVGIGAGLFAFYITRLMLQRTPLDVEHRPRARRAAMERSADA